MRDPKRIERIMELIEVIWVNNPDLRYNQLLNSLQHEYQNGAYIKKAYIDERGWGSVEVSYPDLFYVEDDKFEEFLNEYVKKYS